MADDGRWQRFANQLKYHRNQTDLSQPALARAIHVGESTIAAYETGRRSPNRSTAEAIDQALSAGGSIVHLWDELTDQRAIPEDWRNFEKVELQAMTIREYHATLIPGLLQTRDYARAMLRNSRSWSDDHIERLTSARTARIDNIESAALSFVVDEVVLRRPHGSWDILRAQLDHLCEMIESRRIWMQVIPNDTLTHPGPGESFRIMVLRDGRVVGHEEYRSGINVVTGPQVNELVELFGNLQGEALSTPATMELIRTIREEL